MPVFQSAEHDLDPIATPITSFVVADCLAARLPTGDEGAYPLVFQSFPEPVGVVAPVSEYPRGGRQTTQQGGGSRVVADLACGHEELQGPPLGVGDGMTLGGQPTFRAPDQVPALIIGPPFSPAGSRPCGAPSDRSRRSSPPSE